MSAKHTPGPWQAEPSCPQDGINCYFIVAADRMQIGSVDGYQSEPMREANANLVAAAPELLANLKFAVKLLGAMPMISGTAQVEAMRVAIRRATGEDA